MDNSFKRALAAGGRPLIGLWVGLCDGVCAEISAGAGFDWLLIDGEHAPNDLRTVLAQLQATAPYPVSVIVRPVDGDRARIKQLLDIGAQTLLVPMVDTAEQAQALAQAVRYPPRGVRGVGTALARAARWNRRTDYLNCADDEICLIVQIESRAGLAHLDAIAAVDGVDGVFFGPADLAASMGHLGQPGHAEVRAAIEDGLTRVRAFGKAAGVFATDPGLARAYAGFGAQFIAAGVDTVLLARAAAALAASYKDETAPAAGAAY